MPEKIHPYSAGAKGGLIGGVAMTLPALIYGLVSRGSLWWPINLLTGMVITLPTTPDGRPDLDYLSQFHLGLFLLALVIHAVTSVGVGLMYGVLLPMFPGRPILWGGVVAPLLWTGAIYSFMGVLNPNLRMAVYWPAFILSQFVFGVVTAIVVERSEKVYAEKPRRAPGDFVRSPATGRNPEGNP
jgi:hypothetical protein